MNESKAQPGRPRSERSRQAILKTTVSLIAEQGYERLTISEVAESAGVGKQTIYRWWSSKAELVMDAVVEDAKEYVPLPDTGSFLGDLKQLLRHSCQRVSSNASKNMLTGLLMAGRKDAQTLQKFREIFIETRRDVVRGLLRKHQATGELREDIEVELMVDFVYGCMWYRLLMETAPLDQPFADALANHVAALVVVEQHPDPE